MNKSYRLSILVVLLMLTHFGIVFETGTIVAQETPKFRPKVVINKPFPAIIKPKTVSATEAGKSLNKREMVLGVEVNGESRAYPVNMLNGPTREIINDELGGQIIAATW